MKNREYVSPRRLWLVVAVTLVLGCSFVKTDPVKSKSISGCPEPEQLPHSSYDWIQNSEVEYKCQEGFQLQGEKVRRCNEYGMWVPEAPECVPKLIRCPFPGHNPHSSVNISEFYSSPSTVAAFMCEGGFVLIGTNKRTCLENGTWSDSSNPICAAKHSMNRRVVSASSRVEDYKAIVDDSNLVCSLADAANKVESFWKVDLLEVKSIDIITLIFGNAYKFNVSLYYGENENERNRINQKDYEISTWAGKTSVQNEFATIELKLKKPIKMRYLTVVIPPVDIPKFYFCELLVMSLKGPSFGQCYPSERTESKYSTTAFLKDTCYTFVNDLEASMPGAQSKCQVLTNGTLVTDVTDEIQTLFTLNLNANYQQKRIPKHYFLGGHMEMASEKGGKLEWFWNNNNPIKKFYWGDLQPNMDTRNPSCLTLSGKLGWEWDDRPCDEKFHFICQHKLLKCGYPDSNPLTPLKFVPTSDVGAQVEYHCPEGYEIKGEKFRRCEASGFWSGHAPTCQKWDDGNTGNGNTTAEGHKGGKKGLPIGAIIGIVAGIIVGILIIILITVLVLRKKRGSSNIMKYSTKTESAETLDVDGKKAATKQNYSSMEECPNK